MTFHMPLMINQHLPRGANETLRDGKLAPFRNHLAPFGRSRNDDESYGKKAKEQDAPLTSFNQVAHQ